jgi:cytochrome c553
MGLICSRFRHVALAVRTAGLLAALPTAGWAQTPPAGRLLASNGFQCHGTYGKGPGFDRLAGKSANELHRELRAYRSGKEGRDIMAMHVAGCTDAQLRQIADWLSRQRLRLGDINMQRRKLLPGASDGWNSDGLENMGTRFRSIRSDTSA